MGAGYVGTVSADLHLPVGGSLKDKRRELRRLQERLRAGHRCAVAEVDYQDLWQRAQVTVALVGPDPGELGARIEAISRALHTDTAFVVVDELRDLRAVDGRPTYMDASP
jgi:uncharacterized protein YlxP (DUF503 family)